MWCQTLLQENAATQKWLSHTFLSQLIVARRRSTRSPFLHTIGHSQSGLQFYSYPYCRGCQIYCTKSAQNCIITALQRKFHSCSCKYMEAPSIVAFSFREVTYRLMDICTIGHVEVVHLVVYCAGHIPSISIDDLSCRVIHKSEL